MLSRDGSVCHTKWPHGIVETSFQSEEGRVQKVKLKVMKDGKLVVYTKPILGIVKYSLSCIIKDGIMNSFCFIISTIIILNTLI